MISRIVAALSVCCLYSAAASPIFEGKDGVVVMEAESTSSSKGKWQLKTAVADFTGTGHLEFIGNTPNSGPAESPLKYQFTVDRDGVYHLWIRAHKRLVGDDGEKARGDQCNDCYVRLKGDFEAGGKAPKSVLEKDTKLYVHGKSAESWDWTQKLDYHDPETGKGIKQDPLYTLKAGETYTLIVSGRSQRFNMDRILLKHSEVDAAVAQDPKQPESKSR